MDRLENLKMVMNFDQFDARFAACMDREGVHKLIAMVEAFNKYREKCLKEGVWYTSIPCEFGEDVDDALDAFEKVDD